MTAFLIDAMFPPRTAVLLRDEYGYDATHVVEMDLAAADDAEIVIVAKAAGRVVVTENVKDLAAERDLVLVFVLKKNLPAGGAMPGALAKVLDEWARANPEPYPGSHWPVADD